MEITNKLAVQQMVVASISETDALYAMELLSKMDPASYLVNANAVIQGLVRQGYPLEAIAIVDNSSINELQDVFIHTIINEWLMIDPIDAYTHLSRITNEKIASKIAQRLIVENRFEPVFETEVIDKIQSFVLPENEYEVDDSEFPQIPPRGEIILKLRPQ